ncbi:TetR/AcrR family transcriptional regulator [Geodermatophilus sp. FMUSA9-8]|uniref:TetR/AcrR family transcriptional regulator n=1 Tax=Geodermatophilus sp. FMUSA9-8 TaxID=3120155 RepID=UPI00300BCDD3
MPLDDGALERAAVRVLAHRPDATMEEIAAAAGISRATLFRRHPTRAALVAELSRRAVRSYAEATDRAEPERGPAPAALRRLVSELTALGAEQGILATQPLAGSVEADLLARAASTEDRIRALVRRGQEAGEFRADLPADWVLVALTWLVIGAADGLRTGRLAAADLGRLVGETVLAAVARP